MTAKINIKDGNSGNIAKVDNHNAVATFPVIPEIPDKGTQNRRQFFREILTDMDVDGSSTPVIFTLNSSLDYDIYINRIIVVIEDSKVKEDKYGNITALSNGVDLIIYEGTAVTNIISSGTHYSDLISQTGGFPSEVKLKSTGAELATVLFDVGSILPLGIRLGRATADRLEFTVNDDLTGLEGHTIYIIGFKHVE